MLNNIKFPIVKSEPDPRDYELDLKATRDTGDFNLGDDGKLDQGNTSQCANFSYKALLDPFFDVPLSPSYAYANRFDKDEHQGEGVRGRDIMKDVYHDGLCHIDLMPTHGTIEELKAAFSALPESVHEDAKLHRTESFYRLSTIPDKFLDIMRLTRLQVLLSIPIYREQWKKAQKTGIVFPPDEGDTMIGGHMIRCCGQTDGYLRLINTWGEDYPIDGVQLLHKDYPIWEVWMPVPRVPTKIEMFNGSAEYAVNGYLFTMDTQPEIIKGRMMVPIRFLAEAMLGTFVDWDNSSRTAYVYRAGEKLNFTEGLGFFFSEYGISRTVYDEGVTNYINKDGRMLVPVRAVMEHFGWDVHYNDKTRLITITNGGE